MSEIALTVIKVLYLALLWLFILSAVSVIRSDLFGRTVRASDQPQPQELETPPPPPQEGASGSAGSRGCSSSPRAARPASRPNWPAE